MIASPRRRYGKTLIEMLVVMVGMSAVLVAAGQLFHRLSQAERLVRSSTAVGRAEVRLARTFRQDVRAASSVEQFETDGREGLRLVVPQGTVEYVAQPELVLRTAAGASSSSRDGFRLGTVDTHFDIESDRFAVLTIEPRRAVNRREAMAGPMQVVAAIGAERSDAAATPRQTPASPVEAPKPAEEDGR